MIAFERVCAPGGPAKWCVAADIAGGMSIIDLDCRRSKPSFESVYEIGGRRIACSMLHSTVFAASCSCGVVAAYTRDSGKEMWRKGIDTPQMLTVSDATETLFATTEDQCVLEIGMRDGRVRASREGVKAVWISDDGAALFFEHAREIEVFHLGSDVLQIPKRSFAILAMATNANTVAVSEADGNVYYWDLATASLQLVATMGKESSIVTCAWSSFHNAFLGIEKGTTAQARLIKIGPDLATSPCLAELPLGGNGAFCNNGGFFVHPKGQIIDTTTGLVAGNWLDCP